MGSKVDLTVRQQWLGTSVEMVSLFVATSATSIAEPVTRRVARLITRKRVADDILTDADIGCPQRFLCAAGKRVRAPPSVELEPALARRLERWQLRTLVLDQEKRYAEVI